MPLLRISGIKRRFAIAKLAIYVVHFNSNWQANIHKWVAPKASIIYIIAASISE
jgi:hypothetical protein